MDRARQAFEALFSSHRKTLVWKLFRIVACRDTAEDLVHEAYVRVATALGRHPVDHIPTFLYQTAHNLALDHLRRERSHSRFVDPAAGDETVLRVPSQEASPETAAADRQKLGRLADALATLPERTRRILLLNRIEGMPYPEIAEKLGISPSTVYKDIQLALAHCLTAVDEE
jgi:RNA polymerase sigma factor, sigma-70 family